MDSTISNLKTRLFDLEQQEKDYAAMQPYTMVTAPENLSPELDRLARELSDAGMMITRDKRYDFPLFIECSINNWIIRVVDFASYQGNGRFLAFRLKGNQYQYNDLLIDRVEIQDAPIPTYTVKGSDSIIATIDAAIPSPDYYIEICAPDEAQGQGRVLHATSHRITIDSLEPGTTYRLYTRTTEHGPSCFYRSVTTAMRLQLPLCENFNTYGSCSSCRPTGWSWGIPGNDQIYTTSSYDYSLFFYSYYYNTGYIYASMPDLEIDAIRNLSVNMRYTYRESASVAEVGVMTSPTDWSSFVTIDTLPCNINNWSTRNIDFSSYRGDGRFVAIRIKGNQNQYNALYIDYIRLQACPIPKVELTGYNTIRCSVDTTHTAPDYWVHLTDGSEVDSMIHVATNPYYITDLDTNTAYTLTAQCDSATATCFPSTSSPSLLAFS